MKNRLKRQLTVPGSARFRRERGLRKRELMAASWDYGDAGDRAEREFRLYPVPSAVLFIDGRRFDLAHMSYDPD
jgi:hypothetical protein